MKNKITIHWPVIKSFENVEKYKHLGMKTDYTWGIVATVQLSLLPSNQTLKYTNL
jgi:hypothetical protein